MSVEHRASDAAALIARADKYFHTGSGEYASEIMRDMAEFIRRGEPQGVKHQAPVAWVIPGNDTAREDGSIDAWAWENGEFSRPLYAAQPQAPLITDEMVQHACEIYGEVYVDDDKDMGDAMRAALSAVLSRPMCAWPNCDQPSGHDYCYGYCLNIAKVAALTGSPDLPQGVEDQQPVAWLGEYDGYQDATTNRDTMCQWKDTLGRRITPLYRDQPQAPLNRDVQAQRPGWREYAALSIVEQAVRDLTGLSGEISGITTEKMKNLVSTSPHSRPPRVCPDCGRPIDGPTHAAYCPMPSQEQKT